VSPWDAACRCVSCCAALALVSGASRAASVRSKTMCEAVIAVAFRHDVIDIDAATIVASTA
jgi:hypothetical protein